MPQQHELSDTHSVRHIGIALYNGFALPEVASILEVFQSANTLPDIPQCGGIHYRVRLLSAAGGRIASSSSVFVWTESVATCSPSDHFHALLIVGGTGAREAQRDERLIAWLGRTCPRSQLVLPIGEGRLLLDAAGYRPAADHRRSDDPIAEVTSRYLHARTSNQLRSALSVIHEDLGTEIAHHVTDRVSPPTQTQFIGMVRNNAPTQVSEPVLASARWLEANADRPIAINDAAQAAGMSERNFLRRFKTEMGVTPSDYLLCMRLDMSCRLLAETDLPADKIARRCGIGSGGRLSKLFRKHLGTTPTEYRQSDDAVEYDRVTSWRYPGTLEDCSPRPNGTPKSEVERSNSMALRRDIGNGKPIGSIARERDENCQRI